MREEIMQINLDGVMKLYHVHVYELEDGFNCYKVYRRIQDVYTLNYEVVYCTVAPNLEDARKRTEKFLCEQIKTGKALDECAYELMKMQSKLDRAESEFKNYFSFLLNEFDDGVNIDHIKLNNQEHLYRATRLKTGKVYYEISRKTGREKLKALFKKVIECDITERKLLEKLKCAGEEENREIYELKKSLDDARKLYVKLREKILEENALLKASKHAIEDLVSKNKALTEEIKNGQNKAEEQNERIATLEFVNAAQLEELKELKKDNETKKVLLNCFITGNHFLNQEQKTLTERLEEQKIALKALLRAEAYKRGMVQIKDFENYVEEVLDDFL